MSHTNATTNYSLPQFQGTDKPAWLGDINPAFSAIDTQMKTNADSASGAQSDATTANTNIGTLGSLTTDEKTTLVGAINEVDSHADSAQGTANTAITTANGAKTTAEGIATYFAMTNMANIANNKITINTGSIGTKSLSYASNSTGSLGKLYGNLLTCQFTSSSTTITISDLPFNVSSEFSVRGIVVLQDTNNKMLYYPSVNFKTNNTATIELGAGYNGMTANIMIIATLLFITNFGDLPE